jgi:3-hydroxymyristoyl/3-hydroxydecanoyl-(acyl carrier protein) dehydratase
VPPWYEQSDQASLRAQVLDLHGRAARERLYQAPPGKPHYRLAGGHLDLLDRVTIIEGGGSHQQGYIYASRRTNPAAWFFAAHFKDDPVMPGSLGIEGILQAMQVYALQYDLGSQFASPRFVTLPNHQIHWKYRGQIVREVREWSLEVHITSIERSADQVIITGDASVWRGSLRIYELKQLALRIIETP